MDQDGRMAPLTLRHYIGYACGDAAGSFMFILQAMFLLIFYTDVIGLDPAPVSNCQDLWIGVSCDVLLAS